MKFSTTLQKTGAACLLNVIREELVAALRVIDYDCIQQGLLYITDDPDTEPPVGAVIMWVGEGAPPEKMLGPNTHHVEPESLAHVVVACGATGGRVALSELFKGASCYFHLY